MVSQKRILVPLGPQNNDLKGIYHALALAERMQAKILILQIEDQKDKNGTNGLKEKILLDLVNTASQEGLTVSHHIAYGVLGKEILDFIRKESIELVVLGEDDQMARALLRIRSKVPIQIIQVKEKNNVNYL